MRIALGLGSAALLISAVSLQPAVAATPEAYKASTLGKSLHLQIAGQELTTGSSAASLESTLKAKAEAAGVVAPIGPQNSSTAEVSGDNTKQDNPRTCATPSLATVSAELAELVGFSAGCSTTLAEVAAGKPHAVGTGEVADVEVDLSTIFSQLPIGELAVVLDPLLGGAGELEAALEDALGQPVNATDTVAQVGVALVETETLDVDIAQAKSESTVDDASVTATSRAEGGVVRLFPFGAQLQTATGVAAAPIVEIVVGSATATATYNRATGVSTPSFDPAIVTIRVNTPLVDSVGEITGFDATEIVIGPDVIPEQLEGALGSVPAAIVTKCADAPNEFCVLPDTPLETRIAVASGRNVNNADGSVTAIADAVKVHALARIGDLPDPVGAALDGGILLEIAHAEATVGGTLPVNDLVPDEVRELPETGGTSLLPVGLLGLGAALGVRRVRVRAAAARRG